MATRLGLTQIASRQKQLFRDERVKETSEVVYYPKIIILEIHYDSFSWKKSGVSAFQ